MTLLERLSGWYRTKRTLSAVADRECRHDGTGDLCDACTGQAVGW